MRTFTITIPEDPSIDIRLEEEDLQEEDSKRIQRLKVASELVIVDFLRTAIKSRLDTKNNMIPKPKETLDAQPK